MSRFIVVVHDVQPENSRAITKAINSVGVDWWHWFDSTWLIADPTERTSDWWLDHISHQSRASEVLVCTMHGGRLKLRSTSKDAADWFQGEWWHLLAEAIPAHVGMLKDGSLAVSKWRHLNPNGILNASTAHLIGVDLQDCDLHRSQFPFVQFRYADLRRTNLTEAVLTGCDMTRADLRGANLIGADLTGIKFDRTLLSGANFSDAVLGGSTFTNSNLQDVMGLERIRHVGRTSIDISTLYDSGGKIPEVFLRGCGFVPWDIENAKLYQLGLSAAEITDIQYKVFDLRTGPILSGSFISYSHDDSDFVAVLDKRLQKEGGNVWLDKHQFIAGSVEQNIDRAIRMNDIVILVLSKTSLASDWVWDEIKSAFEKEKKQNRRVLCPIAVDNAWEKDDPSRRHLFRGAPQNSLAGSVLVPGS